MRRLPPLTGLPKHSVNQGSTAVDEDTSPACGGETMVSIVGTTSLQGQNVAGHCG